MFYAEGVEPKKKILSMCGNARNSQKEPPKLMFGSVTILWCGLGPSPLWFPRASHVSHGDALGISARF